MAPILRYNTKWSEVLIEGRGWGGGGGGGGTQQSFLQGSSTPSTPRFNPFYYFCQKGYSFRMPPNDKLYNIYLTSFELLASLLTAVNTLPCKYE